MLWPSGWSLWLRITCPSALTAVGSNPARDFGFLNVRMQSSPLACRTLVVIISSCFYKILNRDFCIFKTLIQCDRSSLMSMNHWLINDACKLLQYVDNVDVTTGRPHHIHTISINVNIPQVCLLVSFRYPLYWFST